MNLNWYISTTTHNCSQTHLTAHVAPDRLEICSVVKFSSLCERISLTRKGKTLLGRSRVNITGVCVAICCMCSTFITAFNFVLVSSAIGLKLEINPYISIFLFSLSLERTLMVLVANYGSSARQWRAAHRPPLHHRLHPHPAHHWRRGRNGGCIIRWSRLCRTNRKRPIG